jgi:uncharacterized protein YccT (UPF0319 family)
MVIFSVISNSENADLVAKIDSVYSANKFKIAPNVYLVADSGVTAEEVANKLELAEKKIAGTIIVRIADYNGYASKSIWEWLGVKESA